MKTKHLITMMTILCLGLIVLSLSTSFSFAPVRNVLGYVMRTSPAYTAALRF